MPFGIWLGLEMLICRRVNCAFSACDQLQNSYCYTTSNTNYMTANPILDWQFFVYIRKSKACVSSYLGRSIFGNRAEIENSVKK